MRIGCVCGVTKSRKLDDDGGGERTNDELKLGAGRTRLQFI